MAARKLICKAPSVPAREWHISPIAIDREISKRERELKLSGRLIFRATYVYPGKQYKKRKAFEIMRKAA